MDNLTKSFSFISKKININEIKYHVPNNIFIKNNEDILVNSITQSYIMKIIIVDGIQYYVPYNWINCENTKDYIRNCIK